MAEAAGGELRAQRVALRSAADRLVEVTGVLWSAGDPALTPANSSIYYFFRHELPKTAAQFDLLASLDATTLDAQPDWF